MNGRVVLISGPCGSGKTTVSRLMAQNSDRAQAVHMHTDDFYSYIKKGYIEPWREGSGDQNETVISAAAACAQTYAKGGFEVFVDGVIGPWFINLWKPAVRDGIDVRYVILRPDRAETIRRGLEREARAEFPLTEQVFANMWDMFAALNTYESYAIDTGNMTIGETIEAIKSRLDAGEFRLVAD